MAATDDELLVANRNGTVSVISSQTLTVSGELNIGKQLSAIAVSSAGDTALLADEGNHELIIVKNTEGKWREVQRLGLSWSPVSVQHAGNDCLSSIACLWARQLVVVENQPSKDQPATVEPRWRIRHVIDLPFAPRHQAFDASTRRIVVADAFGGRLAVVDPAAGNIVSLHQLPGHNLGGLECTPDGKSLVVTLQLLNEFVPTQRDRIVWGAVVSNLVLTIPLHEITSVDSGADPIRPIAHWSVYPLGAAGHGSSDPAAVQCDDSGHIVVALGGVDEVVQLRATRHERRLAVGRRPTAVLYDEGSDRIYVCNTLDDSISVIRAANLQLTCTIELGEKLPLSQRDVGESLFYDARLSLDGWYSCHSCHPNGHSISLRNDNLGDGDYGTPKRIPSLLGSAETLPLGWNGSKRNLEEQICNSLLTTMRDTHPIDDQQVRALAAFLETLSPPPGIDRARGRVDEEAVQRGEQVFLSRGCAECHAPPQYTTPATYDVGLKDERQRNEFNPPSLLGVSQRDSLLHDNRAANLHELFTIHGHPFGSSWSSEELNDLISFLNTL